MFLPYVDISCVNTLAQLCLDAKQRAREDGILLYTELSRCEYNFCLHSSGFSFRSF